MAERLLHKMCGVNPQDTESLLLDSELPVELTLLPTIKGMYARLRTNPLEGTNPIIINGTNHTYYYSQQNLVELFRLMDMKSIYKSAVHMRKTPLTDYWTRTTETDRKSYAVSRLIHPNGGSYAAIRIIEIAYFPSPQTTVHITETVRSQEGFSGSFEILANGNSQLTFSKNVQEHPSVFEFTPEGIRI